MPALDNSRYPIGRFERPGPLDAAARAGLIDVIEQTPATIRSLVEHLDAGQLDLPYRAGGWTIRQVVHHVPDSHMNMYIRMKLAVTEDMPTIKPYDEGRWAELPDGRSAPIAMSLDLLDALHRRWVTFLRALSEDDFRRRFTHPELGSVALFEALAMYAWHGRHHAAHIRNALAT
jgi:DinB family protein